MVVTDKRNDPLETLKTSLAVLRAGKNLITFPEGKLSPSEKPGELKAGIGLIAKETDAAIVPVKKNGRKLCFGRPFRYSDIIKCKAITRDNSPQEIADYIRNKIIEL